MGKTTKHHESIRVIPKDTKIEQLCSPDNFYMTYMITLTHSSIVVPGITIFLFAEVEVKCAGSWARYPQ